MIIIKNNNKLIINVYYLYNTFSRNSFTFTINCFNNIVIPFIFLSYELYKNSSVFLELRNTAHILYFLFEIWSKGMSNRSLNIFWLLVRQILIYFIFFLSLSKEIFSIFLIIHFCKCKIKLNWVCNSFNNVKAGDIYLHFLIVSFKWSMIFSPPIIQNIFVDTRSTWLFMLYFIHRNIKIINFARKNVF